MKKIIIAFAIALSGCSDPDPAPFPTLEPVNFLIASGCVDNDRMQAVQDSLHLLDPDSAGYHWFIRMISPSPNPDAFIDWECDTLRQYVPISLSTAARLHLLRFDGQEGLSCTFYIEGAPSTN